MAALAFLLTYVQKSKFHYELKNPNAVILKKEKLFHTRLSISELMFANFKKKNLSQDKILFLTICNYVNHYE